GRADTPDLARQFAGSAEVQPVHVVAHEPEDREGAHTAEEGAAAEQVAESFLSGLAPREASALLAPGSLTRGPGLRRSLVAGRARALGPRATRRGRGGTSLGPAWRSGAALCGGDRHALPLVRCRVGSFLP